MMMMMMMMMLMIMIMLVIIMMMTTTPPHPHAPHPFLSFSSSWFFCPLHYPRRLRHNHPLARPHGESNQRHNWGYSALAKTSVTSFAKIKLLNTPPAWPSLWSSASFSAWHNQRLAPHTGVSNTVPTKKFPTISKKTVTGMFTFCVFHVICVPVQRIYLQGERLMFQSWRITVGSAQQMLTLWHCDVPARARRIRGAFTCFIERFFAGCKTRICASIATRRLCAEHLSGNNFVYIAFFEFVQSFRIIYVAMANMRTLQQNARNVFVRFSRPRGSVRYWTRNRRLYIVTIYDLGLLHTRFSTPIEEKKHPHGECSSSNLSRCQTYH